MILGILPGESYNGIRALVDLSVCINLYQQLAHARFLSLSIPAKTCHPGPRIKPDLQWSGRIPCERTQRCEAASEGAAEGRIPYMFNRTQQIKRGIRGMKGFKPRED